MAETLRQAVRQQLSGGVSIRAIAAKAGIDHAQLVRFMSETDQHRDLRLESAGKLAEAVGLGLRPLGQ